MAQVDAANIYAFDQACRVRAIEMAASLGIDRRLSINFLPNAVYEPRACIRATLDAADRSGFPRDQLTFEIVETEAIAETAHLLNITREYRRQGFQVALDDFGTGYSGLARLALLKPDIVKLDRVVAQGCDKDPTRLAIVKSIIGLCDDIGVKTVIEGVERLGEVEALRSVGARFIQGFYFGRPLFEAFARDSDVFPAGTA
jgi:EAL domain-containing protein (putative c-di-GMP-specific phosphodiesterase class I)